MVELQLSQWLKPDEFPDDGKLTVKFLDEGVVRESDFDIGSKAVFEIKVEAGKGVERLWTMNLTSQRAVSELYGPETSQWVGETADLFLTEQNVNGKLRKVIYARGKV